MTLRLKTAEKSLLFCFADAIATAAGALCAYLIYPGLNDQRIPSHYLTLILVGVMCTFGISKSLRRKSFQLSATQAAQFVIRVWLATWVALLIWLVFSKSSAEYSRGWLFVWAPSGLLLQVLFAILTQSILSQMHHENDDYTLLLGDLGPTMAVHKKLQSSPDIDVSRIVLGRLNDDELIATWARNPALREVWLCVGHKSPPDIRQILEGPLQQSCANIRVVPELTDVPVVNYGISIIAGFPMIDLVHSPMHGINALIKNLEDKVLATFLIILFLPIYAILATLVKLTSPGPILYSQERVGWNGRVFKMLKFRSMTVDAEASGVQWGGATGKRVTRIGSLMRQTSLDEIPQFFNVLKGEMSIVGPRPERPVFVDQFRDQIPMYMRKHLVKAGITGWAQINGWRGDTDLNKRIAFDLHYIENWSVWFDLKIILATPFKGLIHRNAR